MDLLIYIEYTIYSFKFTPFNEWGDAALTGSSNPSVYWRVLKQRLKNEGNETVTNCNTFKMDGHQIV